MIRWISGVKLDQPHTANDLREKLHVQDIDELLWWNRLRLAGHRYRQEDDTWTKKIMNFRVEGPPVRARPKLKWCREQRPTEKWANDRDD